MFQILNELLTNFVSVSRFFKILLLQELEVYKVVLLLNQFSQPLEAKNDRSNK